MYRQPVVWVNKYQECGDLCVETVGSCLRGILDLPCAVSACLAACISNFNFDIFSIALEQQLCYCNGKGL